jgi:ATP synthase subunit D
MSVAAFSLAEVTYAVGGDIGYQVQESAKSARFRLSTRQDNVSGVLLPAYDAYITEGNNDFGLTGLGKGGQQVQKCRETYARAVEALVELATLQTAFVMLDEVIKTVNRRGMPVSAVLAIYISMLTARSECNVYSLTGVVATERILIITNSEHVIIPRTENTIKCGCYAAGLPIPLPMLSGALTMCRHQFGAGRARQRRVLSPQKGQILGNAILANAADTVAIGG